MIFSEFSLRDRSQKSCWGVMHKGPGLKSFFWLSYKGGGEGLNKNYQNFSSENCVYLWAKSKTSVFAMDGIWLAFSVVLNFLLLGWTPWVGFQNERLMCFNIRQKRNGHSWTCCYSNTICKCDGRNRLFHFFRPSHFKDCVAIAMCLVVALFFPFLIEVRWLLYCVVYSLCNIDIEQGFPT